MWYVNGTTAVAANDRWSYKLSAGWYRPRRDGPPGRDHRQRAANAVSVVRQTGTRQPKFDTRVDYDAPEGAYKLSFAAGFAGTEGMIHTGIGPFDMDARHRARLRLGALDQGRAEGPVLHQHPQRRCQRAAVGRASTASRSCSSSTPRPSTSSTATSTRSAPATSSATAATSATTPSTCRWRRAATTAPRAAATSRTRSSSTTHLRWVVGARLDKFSVLDDPNFSPRTALIVKPTPDHAVRLSFNRAFRAPSLINNFLDVGIFNQLDLRTINPAFAAAPGGPIYTFPFQAVGYDELVEQQVDAYEVAYTGVDRQAGDGDRGVLLQQVEGRHLLHPDRPLPGLEPAARMGGQDLAGGRPGAVARHPRGPAAAVRCPAPSARRADCRASSATATSAR